METREKLQAEVLPCAWPVLRAHHGRGALLVARVDLDLLDAAVAVAEDRSDRVEVWLAVGRLGQPGPDAIERWEAGDTRFQMVIVQPFVIAQELIDG